MIRFRNREDFINHQNLKIRRALEFHLRSNSDLRTYAVLVTRRLANASSYTSNYIKIPLRFS